MSHRVLGRCVLHLETLQGVAVRFCRYAQLASPEAGRLATSFKSRLRDSLIHRMLGSSGHGLIRRKFMASPHSGHWSLSYVSPEHPVVS